MAESAIAANSVLESQGKYVQILNNKLVVRVYKLDNSKTVILVDPTSTVESCLKGVCEKLNVPDAEDNYINFSLHTCLDGVTISRALEKTATMLSVQQGWEEEMKAQGVDIEAEDAPEPRLVLQVRLFTQSMLDSSDTVLVRLQYIQAVYSVIATLYQLDLELCIKLAGLQLYSKFGKFNPEVHKEGFLRSTLLEYIPGTLIRKRKPEEWEALLFEAHEGVDSDHPELDYIAVCKELEYYGCALFPVKQMYDKKLQRRLILGVNRKGILLLKPADNVATNAMKVIAEHSLNDIYRWAYKPGVNFYFEVKPEDEEDDNPLYMFGTVEGKHIADLLTDYAMGLLREMGLNADGTRRDGGDEDEAKGDGEGDEDADDAGDDAADGAAGAGDDDDSGLPDGWVEVPDEASGAVYFYNNETGESRWDRPT